MAKSPGLYVRGDKAIASLVEHIGAKPCPRCRLTFLRKDDARNALSRRDNKTYICTACGIQEALIDAGYLTADEREALFSRGRIQELETEELIQFLAYSRSLVKELLEDKAIRLGKSRCERLEITVDFLDIILESEKNKLKKEGER